MTDQNVALLIGLGTATVALLGANIPLVIKLIYDISAAKHAAIIAKDTAEVVSNRQQDHAIRMDKAMSDNTVLTQAAVDKIEVANDISGKLLTANKNILSLQRQIGSQQIPSSTLEEKVAGNSERIQEMDTKRLP